VNPPNQTSEALQEINKKQYFDFIDRFNTKIDEVEKLDTKIISQWSSPLSMIYHYLKHKSDFSKELEIREYFEVLTNELFKKEYATSINNNKIENLRSFPNKFGTRARIGVAFGKN
jgi:hypothetical protein